MAHAVLSPSKASRWMTCPGSIALEANIPDTTSAYAAEGTLAHEVAARVLMGAEDPMAIDATLEMLQHVFTYVDVVHSFVTPSASLFIEQRLEFSETIGVDDSFGTADAVIVDGDTITLCDLKYGMGVRVDAEQNDQLQIYGLAALEQFGMAGDFKHVRLVIVQPRLGHTTEWLTTVEDLEAFGRRAKAAAQEAVSLIGKPPTLASLHPSTKACKFCKAAAICPKLGELVSETVGADFEVIDEGILEEPKTMGANYLGHCLGAVDLIEQWCLAVRARVEAELFAGNEIDGYKLVAGRQGARKWAESDDVADILEKALGEAAFEVSLISPTTAEKKLKATPNTWAALQPLIQRSEGKPSVAPLHDKRPAISPMASPDDFNVID